MIEILPLRARVSAVFADARMQRAFRIFRERESEIESEQVRLTMIPAPPFEERERAAHVAEVFQTIGLNPSQDAIGNVLVWYAGAGPNPVIVGAHLDTVFPRHINLQLRRKNGLLYLPGIADNGAGLAALIWMMRAAREAGLEFRRPVLALANVGEEGLGNLRGVRHLFTHRPWGSRECDFIALDVGGLQRITHQALGSRRFRIRMRGPGGHSWADFGRPNPVHAMATAVHNFAAFPRRPATTFNVGMIHGGIGVNVIPREATMEVDLRSSSIDQLDQLNNHLKRCVSESAQTAGLHSHIESMGERPSGHTAIQSELVQAAAEATRIVGCEPQFDIGSTDANIPMSLGIPAVSIGPGGAAGNTHTPDEWFDPAQRYLGLQRLLGLVAAVAGLR
jgi:acetylornithine deacetylase/succinyl-diaminopimelate desuccinylase-like protein